MHVLTFGTFIYVILIFLIFFSVTYRISTINSPSFKYCQQEMQILLHPKVLLCAYLCDLCLQDFTCLGKQIQYNSLCSSYIFCWKKKSIRGNHIYKIYLPQKRLLLMRFIQSDLLPFTKAADMQWELEKSGDIEGLLDESWRKGVKATTSDFRSQNSQDDSQGKWNGSKHFYYHQV